MSFQTKDYELPLGAEKIEGISSLSFNPSKLNNFLVATSWDSKVSLFFFFLIKHVFYKKIRLWEIHSLSSASGKAAMSADAPILCSAWSSVIFSLFFKKSFQQKNKTLFVGWKDFIWEL